ncbi:hypothetical protein R3P38DRAFT_3007799 [Favolaschia claudopus]|uniref:BTB domain-containing protein n=1 Tax=Favolaschia claudopus TaxID=2862362 RepID=A0AAW0AIJ1_9AGAR
MAQAAQSPSPPVFVTTPPFDEVSADTILRSSDGIDFHVWRVILSSASPFFKDLFSLPQDTSSDAGIPVIPVAENSQLLDAFLRFWYPDVIELAMMKYDLQYLAPPLRRQLETYKEAHCLSVFAIAAKSPHLERITGQQFRCSKAASAARRSESLPWTDPHYAWIECTSCEPYPFQFHSTVGPPKIVACGQLTRPCPCQSYGLRDLFEFITEKYVPAINEAIEAVPLRI